MTESLTLADLVEDPQNARVRTERSAAMLEESVNTLGAGRSILIDANNKIVAGHGTVDACASVGIEKVLVVETDGQTLIAVRRADLTPSQSRRMAYLDNRTGELATWDPKVVQQDLQEHPVDLKGLFSAKELGRLLKEPVELPAAQAKLCPHCGKPI